MLQNEKYSYIGSHICFSFSAGKCHFLSFSLDGFLFLSYFMFHSHFTNSSSPSYFTNLLFARILPIIYKNIFASNRSANSFIFACSLYYFSNRRSDHEAVVWQDLSTTQLLNWPHVEVRFHTQNICFVRRQETEFVRYLNFLPPESSKISEGKIENAENLHSYERQKDCYS
jgi:hypothetical protein